MMVLAISIVELSWEGHATPLDPAIIIVVELLWEGHAMG